LLGVAEGQLRARLEAGLHAEFAEQRRDAALDRPLADAEVPGARRVGEPGEQQGDQPLVGRRLLGSGGRVAVLPRGNRQRPAPQVLEEFRERSE